jgi:hypothetical protein
MAKSESPFAKFASRLERIPILLVLIWMVLYLPRPFELGFYLDDWWALLEPQHATAPFSLDRLHYFVGFATSYGPRPLMGFIAFLVTSIAGLSSVATQFISTLLVLGAALSLRAWLNRIMGVFPRYRNVTGDFAVIFWLAVPWMLGETAWPDVAHNLAAQILFTETARLLLLRERLTAGLAILVSAGIVASGLVYEAFYFAIFPVIAFYAAFGRGAAKSRREIASLFGICCLAQGIAVGFNRYAAYAHAEVTKTFDSRWPLQFVGNILALPRTLIASFSEYPVLVLTSAALVIICAALLWSSGRRLESERLYCSYLAGLMAAAVAIFLISTIVYSAAGYGFGSLGMESRTLYPGSFAFTIAFFALLSSSFLSGARFRKAGLLTAAAALVLFLAVAQRHRVQEWAFAWREELRILKSAPLDAIQHLPSQAAIFYVGPSSYRGVVIFGEEWDLTAAVAAQSPLNRNRRPYQNMHSIYPAGDRRTWVWDGVTLSRTKPGVPQQTFPVQQLYLWRQDVPNLQQIERGFRWPPETQSQN